MFISWIYNASFAVFFFAGTVVLLLCVANKILDILFTSTNDGRGTYALITGCDSGFGYSAAHALNTSGVCVFAACLTPAAVDMFNNDEEFHGTAFQMNVTNKDDIAAATTMITERCGEKGLKFLFNNAGIGQFGPIEWLSEEDLRRTSEVNLWGHINVTKAVLPLIKKSRGRIINTTSVLGRVAMPLMSPYCISKFAFEAFSDALRHEMRPWGVSVHLIEPGLMRTDLYRRDVEQLKTLWERQPDDIREAYGERYMEITLKKMNPTNVDRVAADPKQVIEAYVHAALSTRPRNRYLIGVDAHVLAFTIGMLPTSIGDYILNKLHRSVKPAAAVVR